MDERAQRRGSEGSLSDAQQHRNSSLRSIGQLCLVSTPRWRKKINCQILLPVEKSLFIEKMDIFG